MIFFLGAPWMTHAVVTPPAQTVWVTPSDAKSGAAIELNAFVYNNTKNDVSATVVFATDTKDIGTATVMVIKEGGKTATLAWIMPETAATVTATITKVTNVKDKKDVEALKGRLGIIVVGAQPPIAVVGVPNQHAIKEWFTVHLAGIEAWRVAKADTFAAMRDQAKHNLGITIARKVEEKIAKEIAGVEPEKPTSVDSQNNPKDYVVLIGATALASLFASMLMFYTVAIVLASFILRFIIRRFI